MQYIRFILRNQTLHNMLPYPTIKGMGRIYISTLIKQRFKWFMYYKVVFNLAHTYSEETLNVTQVHDWHEKV